MFLPQIKRVGRKSSENGEKFSQSGLGGILEIGVVKWREIGWGGLLL